jgi:hypothetical protein
MHLAKAFDKIQHPSTMKALKNLGKDKPCLNIIKENHTANIIQSREKLKLFSPCSLLLLNIVLDILA